MKRTERFSQFMREEISGIIRKEVSDPRIGFISITGVDVSPDLKDAKIYVSILGSESQKKGAMAGLTSATGFIRRKLADMISGRSIPQICFIRDDSLEQGSKVLGLISKLENEEKTVRKNKKRVKKS